MVVLEHCFVTTISFQLASQWFRRFFYFTLLGHSHCFFESLCCLEKGVNKKQRDYILQVWLSRRDSDFYWVLGFKFHFKVGGYSLGWCVI